MGRLDDEDPFGTPQKKAPAIHVVGEPLDTLSVDELDERISLLRREIERLEEARSVREASRKAANSIFKF